MNNQTPDRAAYLEALVADFTEPVRDPLWGNIFLSPGLEALLGTPAFSRLAGIRQLGPAYLVYPGATHSRLAHSLGVFHLARRLLFSLALRGELDRAGLAPSREALHSFLAAALAHDLGHFPYAHSLKELPLTEHESLSARLLRTEPLRSAVGKAGADPELAAAIVERPPQPEAADRELRFFRGLLSGVLDPDKLDYLNRDAFFCGVPYGVQDTEYVLERVALTGAGRLGVEERGLMSVESVLFSKYLMYRSVYWHRGVRSATAVVKKALFLALREGILKPENLYGLDDAGFAQLLRAKAAEAPCLEPAAATLEGRTWACLLDLPFDEGDEGHRSLLDLSARLRFEEELSRRAVARGFRIEGAFGLLIDIPEAISFESDLPILGAEGSERPFGTSQTVFSPAVVAGFSRSLRRLRLFAAAPSAALGELAREALGPGIRVGLGGSLAEGGSEAAE